MILDAPREKGKLAVSDIVTIAKKTFNAAPEIAKYKQTLRPYICPFHVLVDLVPQGSTVLDVGCGGGLFLLLLAYLGRIRSGFGFDNNQTAIEVARTTSFRLSTGGQLQFEHRDLAETWPGKRFDVVCVIDVMHHVRPDRQRQLIASASGRVAEGGFLLYKDMVRRPRWRAWANRIHDLVLAREWIHYVDLEQVVAWAKAEGLEIECRGSLNMLWYGHEWCKFVRRSRA